MYKIVCNINKEILILIWLMDGYGCPQVAYEQTGSASEGAGVRSVTM